MVGGGERFFSVFTLRKQDVFINWTSGHIRVDTVKFPNFVEVKNDSSHKVFLNPKRMCTSFTLVPERQKVVYFVSLKETK